MKKELRVYLKLDTEKYEDWEDQVAGFLAAMIEDHPENDCIKFDCVDWNGRLNNNQTK